ncbi:hypothetical protein WN51_09563 [Melipona quadrifasciata]|uniref:Uncharacterized protein n=1 Tax=Melipona quadrifasciata TaxID=166423 RepID=A0A0N0BIT3_9HYME|nr:hypothetical protein WN51_09563 [Melipona quadrifasciata]
MTNSRISVDRPLASGLSSELRPTIKISIPDPTDPSSPAWRVIGDLSVSPWALSNPDTPQLERGFSACVSNFRKPDNNGADMEIIIIFIVISPRSSIVPRGQFKVPDDSIDGRGSLCHLEYTNHREITETNFALTTNTRAKLARMVEGQRTHRSKNLRRFRGIIRGGRSWSSRVKYRTLDYTTRRQTERQTERGISKKEKEEGITHARDEITTPLFSSLTNLVTKVHLRRTVLRYKSCSFLNSRNESDTLCFKALFIGKELLNAADLLVFDQLTKWTMKSEKRGLECRAKGADAPKGAEVLERKVGEGYIEQKAKRDGTGQHNNSRKDSRAGRINEGPWWLGSAFRPPRVSFEEQTADDGPAGKLAARVRHLMLYEFQMPLMLFILVLWNMSALVLKKFEKERSEHRGTDSINLATLSARSEFRENTASDTIVETGVARIPGMQRNGESLKEQVGENRKEEIENPIVYL